MKFVFNTTLPVVHEPVLDTVSASLIEATPVLRQPSLDKAALFGGPLVRQLLEQVPVVGDKNHVIVDTKVTMLMPGWYPAIPGWHTDGVPRGDELKPNSKGSPRLDMQLNLDSEKPRYHVISVGLDSPTEFLNESLEVDLENFYNPKLYKELTQKVNRHLEDSPMNVLSTHNAWVSWDWWNVHRAIPATKTGWRLLIRVTESDTLAPRESDFIRSQSQVYVPTEFGW